MGWLDVVYISSVRFNFCISDNPIHRSVLEEKAILLAADMLDSYDLMPMLLEAMKYYETVGCCLYFFDAFYLLHF